MRPRRTVRLCLLAASAFIFCAAAARAQDSSRVVRLSRTDGQVVVAHPGDDTWYDAPVNLPLQEGDTLATQAGMAEIEFENGATAYLAENSVLQFVQLSFSGGGRVTQLNLTQGAGTFYANLTRQDSFQVITSTFEVAIPERAEVRVDAFRDGASIEVLSGHVSVTTSKGSTTFEKGESVAIHQGDLQNPQVARLPDQDAFDQWVSEQSEVIRSGNKNTLSYVNSPNYYGLSDLSIYGTWVNLPGYGNSWRPFSMGLSWTPFMNGKWILDPRLGWMWVSSEPWGWVPYHFGSWLLSPTLGWVWVPGGPASLSQWQPALVNWVRSGNQVCWVAKSPNDREGAPANLDHGAISTAIVSQRNRDGSNQIVAKKDLANVVALKQPPADFASHVAPVAPRSGLASSGRTISQPIEGNGSVVFDRGAHTFVNGNGNGVPATPPAAATLTRTGGRSFSIQGNQGQPARESSARGDVQRVTIPPPASMDSQTRRVVLPPPGPAPISRMLPNGAPSSSTTMPAPPAARSAGTPPPMLAAPPRPVNPPTPPQTRYMTPPVAPQTPAPSTQTSSVARPSAPASAPVSARPPENTAPPRR
jgi:hypothetical protein